MCTICMVGVIFNAFAKTSEFAKLQFGDEIFIEVPKSWQFLNENIRQHINNATEATARLAGMPVSQKDNLILISANTFTTHKNPSATLHLNVRPSKSMTQADMHKLVNLTTKEIESLFGSAQELLERTYKTLEDVKSAKVLTYKIDNNKNVTCLFTENEITKKDGLVFLTQTWICPAGNKFVKLGTSYNKDEANIFKPVINYVWSTLKIN